MKKKILGITLIAISIYIFILAICGGDFKAALLVFGIAVGGVLLVVLIITGIILLE